MTSSRRSCSKSTSMSGGSLRSSDTKREKSRSCLSGSMDVTPSRKRSEEHTSELQSLMRISYAVFCLKKKKKTINRQEIRKKQSNHNDQDQVKTIRLKQKLEQTIDKL